MAPDMSPERYADNMEAAQRVRLFEIEEPSGAWAFALLLFIASLAIALEVYAEDVDRFLVWVGL